MLAGSGMSLGAQNLDIHPSGAFTGEISGEMLKDVGCDYVIVGHSERRALYGESDKRVGEKAKAAVAQGLKAIVCLGETEEERDRGVTADVVTRQLVAVLDEAGGNIFPNRWSPMSRFGPLERDAQRQKMKRRKYTPLFVNSCIA